jgi:hypothetical protein
LVATFAASTRAQLCTDSASPSNCTIISENGTTTNQNPEHRDSSRGVVRSYLDPVNPTKYYVRYTHGGGKVKFVKKTCPIATVFNQTTKNCTNIEEGSNNPPTLSYIASNKCNGVIGYYCKHGKYTYCTEDNLKIVRNKQCPGGVKCRIGKNNPCICDSHC